MTDAQALATVGLVALATMITRFLPFLLFPNSDKAPAYIRYLGQVLPYAAIGFLVIYCLKSVSLVAPPYGLPEGIALACVVGLHLWRKNTLLSIGVGTIVYMFLVQCVFI